MFLTNSYTFRQREKMGNQTVTIRKFVKYLNNKDEQGGYWLPNIQRPFV